MERKSTTGWKLYNVQDWKKCILVQSPVSDYPLGKKSTLQVKKSNVF